MKQLIRLCVFDCYSLFRTSLTNFLDSSHKFCIAAEADNWIDFRKTVPTDFCPPEICIVDISMPQLAGFETLLSIRRKWPEARTLILTTFLDEYAMKRALHWGINGFLLKKCSSEELLTALREIHLHKYYYSDLFTEGIAGLAMKKSVRVPSISKREQQFLTHCLSDLTYAEISDRMGISIKTVDCFRTSLFSKLHVNNRIDLVKFSMRNGIHMGSER